MSAKTTEKTSAKGGFKSERRRHDALTVIFSILSFIYLIPIFLVAMNSFKSNASINLETFAFPREGTFVALDNYIKGLTFGNYPFLKSAGYSLLITIVSAALILLCTSMAAWYIARVGSGFSKLVYYLCVFSMVVPFQMVMFTLARTADTLKLNTPYTIPIIYLGFGAGLAVFMFSGFIKSIPLEIEEAAAIDGCGPIRTYVRIMLPMAQSSLLVCGVLSLVWHWNDYFEPGVYITATDRKMLPHRLPSLYALLNAENFNMIQMTDIEGLIFNEAMIMAATFLCILPILIMYLILQRRFMEGVERSGLTGM